MNPERQEKSGKKTDKTMSLILLKRYITTIGEIDKIVNKPDIDFHSCGTTDGMVYEDPQFISIMIDKRNNPFDKVQEIKNLLQKLFYE